MRHGMTILEVLFAIMITAVGLLGAVAVFPVASQMARKGRINDMVTEGSESAAHKFDAQGMRRLDQWVALVDNTANNSQPVAVGGAALQSSPLFWKTSFCIDPRFTASNIGAHAVTEQNWTRFPAFPNAGTFSPRMQRLTLANGMGGIMGKFQADLAFTIEDEPIYTRPGEESMVAGQSNADPALQQYTGSALSSPGKRQDSNKLSWMATVCPKMDLVTGRPDGGYVVSIVTYYPRIVGPTRDFSIPISPPFTEDAWPDNEYTVSIAGSNFFSNGFGGGEVRLHADYAEKLNVKTGSWVMLAGNQGAKPDANGKPTELVQIFKWYRVSDVGELDTQVINGTSYAVRDVTLIGPDWDMQDVMPFGGAAAPVGNGVPDDVEVTIVPGVVNVIDRTVRLEL